ncbi:MAG: flagellar basal body rod protein FlgB [Candidatus Thiodiazotropha sp. (ex Dulcina madagascariensis)]|nr:flagellar basal body rod protein FlgB [Candidatus Thiodiazotropha sp. (ex Dulcina madagascariensis)]MCU7927877.1 flagellar basal body rod protein FlgB [Candidatus Thiodiazotropha sp. (ex Dulcina madagascariensis)]
MNFDDIFGIHERALVLRSQRAEVLAANLANADTPGYKARDFDFKSLLQNEMVGGDRMRTTHQSHIQTETGPVPPSQLLYRTPTQPSLDGNSVDTEREHVAFSANAIEYQASLSFINSKISGIRKALRGD